MGSGLYVGFGRFLTGSSSPKIQKTTLDKHLKQGNVSGRTGFRYKPNVIKQQVGITLKSEEKMKILFAHDNRKEYYTGKAHQLAEFLGHHPQIESIVDYKTWGRNETTSQTEINNREKQMVERAGLIVRIITPTSRAGERNEGAVREVNKGINAGKPVLEIFMTGAHDTPNRPAREKNYGNREEVHLKPGQPLLKGFQEGLKRMADRGLLGVNVEFDH